MRGKSHADIGKMSFGESGEESEDEKKHAVPHQPTIGGVHGVCSFAVGERTMRASRRRFYHQIIGLTIARRLL
jgi:hypothetical protein